MNILAIDTSANICGVSILKNNIIKTYDRTIGLNHSVVLFQMIDNALKDNNINMKDINFILVSNGPGSYTGLRIGVSAAIGLSTPNNIPIIYIDTLESLSQNIPSAGLMLPIIDAKANRVYTALFDNMGKRYSGDEILDIDNFIRIIENFQKNKKLKIKPYIYILGDAVDIYKDKLKKILKYNNVKLVSKDYRYNNSKSLIILYNKFYKNRKKKENVNINYMQKSQAERNLENNK